MRSGHYVLRLHLCVDHVSNVKGAIALSTPSSLSVTKKPRQSHPELGAEGINHLPPSPVFDPAALSEKMP
jgi:hypothetical protein